MIYLRLKGMLYLKIVITFMTSFRILWRRSALAWGGHFQWHFRNWISFICFCFLWVSHNCLFWNQVSYINWHNWYDQIDITDKVSLEWLVNMWIEIFSTSLLFSSVRGSVNPLSLIKWFTKSQSIQFHLTVYLFQLQSEILKIFWINPKV